MTTGHIFYIPLMIAVGLVVGLLLGRRSHAVEAEEQTRLEARRQARRKRAGLASAAQGDDTAPPGAPTP